MNLVDAEVIEVTSAPYYMFARWYVDVWYESYGIQRHTELMCMTEEDARSIKPGHKFLI